MRAALAIDKMIIEEVLNYKSQPSLDLVPIFQRYVDDPTLDGEIES
jgi:hypothetical protein